MAVRRVADIYEWVNIVLIPGLFGNAGGMHAEASVAAGSAAAEGGEEGGGEDVGMDEVDEEGE